MINFVKPFFNLAPKVPIKASAIERKQMRVQMLQDTYNYLVNDNPDENLCFNKINDFFKNFLPEYNITAKGRWNLNARGLCRKQNDGYILSFLKTKENYAKDNDHVNALMHEITHLYDFILNPKISKLPKRLLEVGKFNLPKIGFAHEKYKIFVYKKERKFDKKKFVNTINFQLSDLNNLEKIDYLKHFYNQAKMEKIAFSNGVKYGYPKCGKDLYK